MSIRTTSSTSSTSSFSSRNGRTTRRTRTLFAAVLGSAALAVAACGSSTEGSGSPSTPAAATSSEAATTSAAESSSSDETASSGTFDQAAAQDVLITAEDAGSGFTQIPDAQLQQAIQQQGQSQEVLNNATIEPKECETVYKAQAGLAAQAAQSLKDGAVRVLTQGSGASSGTIVTEALAPSTAGVADFDPSSLGDCKDITLSVSGVTAKVTTEEADAPDLGEKSFAYTATTATQAGGQSVNLTTYTAVVLENGKLMTLAVVSAGGSGGADLESTGSALVQKAYDKAQDFLSS